MQPWDGLLPAASSLDVAALSALRRSPLPVSRIRCVEFGIFCTCARAHTEFVTAVPDWAALTTARPSRGGR